MVCVDTACFDNGPAEVDRRISGAIEDGLAADLALASDRDDDGSD